MNDAAGPSHREIGHELREALDEAARIALQAKRVARDVSDQEEVGSSAAHRIESADPEMLERPPQVRISQGRSRRSSSRTPGPSRSDDDHSIRVEEGSRDEPGRPRGLRRVVRPRTTRP